MNHLPIGSTAKDQAVNSSPPVSQNGLTPTSLPTSLQEKNPELSGVETSGDTNSTDPLLHSKGLSNPSQIKQQEAVRRPEQNLYGGQQQRQDTNHPTHKKCEESTAQAKGSFPSISKGKRPRENKDAPSQRDKFFKFVTTNEDVAQADYWYIHQNRSEDMLPLDSGPEEMGLHIDHKHGVQCTTSHPTESVTVSGKHQWKSPKRDISITVWYRHRKIMTLKSKEPYVRCSNLVKIREMQNYVNSLKETSPKFKGFYLCDMETRRCVFMFYGGRHHNIDIITI
ncbi:uncharacterized protein LOC117329037 isoform X2 [Pecten maximus]|nr:uncharacterized protein LOC117329037 isoform X2 [Pecten maximus]